MSLCLVCRRKSFGALRCRRRRGLLFRRYFRLAYCKALQFDSTETPLTIHSACICAGIRIAYSIDLMKSDDKTYYITQFTLVTAGETTGGFLILCSPAMPQLFKSSPLLQKFVSKFRSWTGSSSGSPKASSRLGLPSWIRVQGQPRTARERRMEDTNFSDIEGLQHTNGSSENGLSQSSTKQDGVIQVMAKKETSQVGSLPEFITVHEV